jgi:hypothetical protein
MFPLPPSSFAEMTPMATELDGLRIISDRLSTKALAFMLTGSFALAYYATPRMTRDLDIVVALREPDIGPNSNGAAPCRSVTSTPGS